MRFAASPVSSSRGLSRMQREILGPRGPFDRRRFSSVRRTLSRVEYPWDDLLTAGVAVGLYGTLLAGLGVIAWTGGSWLGSLVGVALVGLCVGASSHLVPTSPRFG